MELRTEHSARIREPEEFQTEHFRRKNITDGIDIIISRPHGEEKMATQAYRFNAKLFTPEKAKVWLAKHDIDYVKFEEATPKNEIKPTNEKQEKKKNPRPPLYDSGGMIGTEGIGGVIYFGYKCPPTEFKTKKAKKESARKLYDRYKKFMKDYNLKPDGKLSDVRKEAYEHGGTKKLKARRKKRGSTIDNPCVKKNPGKSAKAAVKNPSNAGTEKAVEKTVKFFADTKPKRKIKLQTLNKRTIFIYMAEPLKLEYETKFGGEEMFNNIEFDGGKMYWDLENNALIIESQTIELIKRGAFRRKNEKPVREFDESDIKVAVNKYKAFHGHLPRKISYNTLKNEPVMIKIGKAATILYRSNKYGGRKKNYHHPLDDCRMYFDMANNAIVIIGNNLEITKRGIVG